MVSLELPPESRAVIRIGSLPSRCLEAYMSRSSSEMPGSVTLVMPRPCRILIPASTDVEISCALKGGITDRTSPWAVSRNTPVGSPAASFSITPPGGGCVSRVIPAIRMTTLFTAIAWNEKSVRATGLLGETGSRSFAVGARGSRLSFQSRPRIHAFGCDCATASRTTATSSSIVAVSTLNE
jgi:hypothetical protein